MKNRGFTLVETLVAIAIIMVAIIGPFITIETDLTASYSSRDELIANSLAQEGLEYIHQMRDNQYLTDHIAGNNTPFFSSINSSCINANCTIDPFNSTNPILPCSSTCSPLYVTSAGTYTQSASGNTKTRFTRTFQYCYGTSGSTCITTPGNMVIATVTVTWTTENQQHTTTLTDNLYNWML